ncbi:MAG: flagellar biosynthetic protein FliR [Spirochaetia bacterium]|jgi:flagellar biosynthetic protein FliR|nr:flagellar biosynthetic protein FliR [Spirochaetia bacterium]
MFLQSIAENSQLYLLIFSRIFALLTIAPLLSSSAIPDMARAALALFTTVAIFPVIYETGYLIPESGLAYLALMAGEIMIGVVTGFFLQLIFAAFLMAGQFFSLQMGFSASVVFDPLAQEEIPIVGQFLNYFAMFVFLASSGFYKVFITGVYRSFQSLNAYTFLLHREHIYQMALNGIGKLFQHSLLISMPILATLFLISVSMGLLAKAAPQMNLLMMGFPVAIIVAFLIILFLIPFLTQAFSKLIDESFYQVLFWYSLYRGSP